MDGQKPLGLPARFEPSHLSFALACGLMRQLGPIVGVTVSVVTDGRHDGSQRGSIALEFVGNDPERFLPLTA